MSEQNEMTEENRIAFIKIENFLREHNEKNTKGRYASEFIYRALFVPFDILYKDAFKNNCASLRYHGGDGHISTGMLNTHFKFEFTDNNNRINYLIITESILSNSSPKYDFKDTELNLLLNKTTDYIFSSPTSSNKVLVETLYQLIKYCYQQGFKLLNYDVYKNKFKIEFLYKDIMISVEHGILEAPSKEVEKISIPANIIGVDKGALQMVLNVLNRTDVQKEIVEELKKTIISFD